MSDHDAKNLQIIFQPIFFAIALIFVFISGVVSDILNILLAPITIRSIKSRFIIKVNTNDVKT